MVERGGVRRRVDAAGKSRGDDKSFKREAGGDLAGEFLSDGGAVAGADDGDDRNVGELQPAFDEEEGRRRIDLRERRRIARLADRDQACPKLSAASSSASASASVQRRMSERPPRRDRSGSAAMAASAPPNSLTRARKVAGPTFSLRISLSQATR